MPDVADAVVIGGGCEGSSIAWQLARRGVGRVVLLEKLGVAAGATGRSSAIVRQHYTHETLARMAHRAVEIFSHFDEVVGGDAEFRQVGFLALYGEDDAETLAANVVMQRDVGIKVELLRDDDLREVEPRMVRDDVAGAAWEPDGGYADPVATTNSFIAAARRLGVDCRIGAEVERLLVEGERVVGVATRTGEIQAGTVVVAAGYRSRELLAPHGFEFPVTPVRHAIAIVERSVGFGRPHPVVADRLTGSYYRPEGATLTLIGASKPHEGQIDTAVEIDRTPDPEEMAVLASRYCQRFPSEQEAGMRRGYTGVYDCTPDLQPLIGPVPRIDGLYMAAGFSGHGFKLSPVVGELVAEKIVDGRTSLVDLDFFSPSRYIEGRMITTQLAYSMATLG